LALRERILWDILEGEEGPEAGGEQGQNLLAPGIAKHAHVPAWDSDDH